jgi:AcrR family transcriptional regulator
MASNLTAAELQALPLRARKRVLTRRSILDAAERLFEERGFEHVTVAQIADAANVSVKTLFAYFRSKEDLAFTDTWLLDACVTAIEERPGGQRPAQAVAAALVALLRDGGRPDQRQTVAEGIEGFHRGYGGSPALHARLLRMWEEYEDQVTSVLAAEAGTAATPAMRLQAIGVIGLLRGLTSPEMRAALAGRPPAESLAYVCGWLGAAGDTVSAARAGTRSPNRAPPPAG